MSEAASPDQARSEAELRRALWEEANRVIIDSAYSGRAHQLLGSRWERVNTWLGVPTTVLSAVLAAGNGSFGSAGLVRLWTAALSTPLSPLLWSESRQKSKAAAHYLRARYCVSLRRAPLRPRFPAMTHLLCRRKQESRCEFPS